MATAQSTQRRKRKPAEAVEAPASIEVPVEAVTASIEQPVEPPVEAVTTPSVEPPVEAVTTPSVEVTEAVASTDPVITQNTQEIPMLDATSVTEVAEVAEVVAEVAEVVAEVAEVVAEVTGEVTETETETETETTAEGTAVTTTAADVQTDVQTGVVSPISKEVLEGYTADQLSALIALAGSVRTHALEVERAEIAALLAEFKQRAAARGYNLETLAKAIVQPPKKAAAASAGAKAPHPSAGTKVEPKYRDPETNDTWTGRGQKPTWLVARIAAGASPEDFLIVKPEASAEAPKA